MPKPRIRLPFIGAFALLCLISAYLGLLPHTPPPDPTNPPTSTSPLPIPLPNDKFLHFITFFILTTTFYWILDTSRRRQTHLTLIICTGLLGVGSEFVQAVLPNGREFDVWDVAANIVGSVLAVLASGFFHGRLLERRRGRGRYGVIAQQGDEEEDVELGIREAEHDLEEEQESGVVDVPVAETFKSVEAELDNWDENEADEWDDDDATGENIVTPSTSSVDQDIKVDAKKRVD